MKAKTKPPTRWRYLLFFITVLFHYTCQSTSCSPVVVQPIFVSAPTDAATCHSTATARAGASHDCVTSATCCRCRSCCYRRPDGGTETDSGAAVVAGVLVIVLLAVGRRGCVEITVGRLLFLLLTTTERCVFSLDVVCFPVAYAIGHVTYLMSS
jgi:hypothetical protein